MSDEPQGSDTPETPATAPYTGSLARIAKRHEEIRADSTLTLFVPGYEGMMKVRYRLLPEVDMDRLGQRIEEVKRGEGVAGAWKVEADSLVAMCDQILVREEDSDGYEVLSDENGPIRFEGRFAQVLQKVGVTVNGAKATEIVLDFFSPRADPANPASPRLYPNAMERHTNAIFAWNRGEKEKIDRTLLGE
jgi:hypothetical protein